MSGCLNRSIDYRNLIRHGTNLWKVNTFDNAWGMIRCYQSPRCVFVSNHGFICTVWFGLAGRWWMWSVSQLNLQFSWTLQSDSVPAVSLRTSPASVCSKRCEHIVAGRLEAWLKRFTEGGRKGQKGREGEQRKRGWEFTQTDECVCSQPSICRQHTQTTDQGLLPRLLSSSLLPSHFLLTVICRSLGFRLLFSTGIHWFYSST